VRGDHHDHEDDQDEHVVRPFFLAHQHGAGGQEGGGDGRSDRPPRGRDEPDEDDHVVRPFFLTGGRTDADLAFEAMVVVTDAGRRPHDDLSAEYGKIVELCAEPQAVAEIAAKLSLPIGVARVLVSDLAERGLLELPSDDRDDPDVDLIERLISGVRRI